ncbi:MAG: rubrerythrin family protein [Candidatus Caenarcaniphilales bacterium]|jgi:rubrerythrin|nr:rubrerythrin family protein [Candidatus Caenarcaniphilales bacterium]
MKQEGVIMKNTQTQKNLEAAFAGESMAYQRYLYFGKLARQLGNLEVAELFENTAKQETAHAFAHLDLVYASEKMTVQKLLQIAIEGELHESNYMYPEFEKTALDEAQIDAVLEFQEQALESKDHAEIFQKAAKRFKSLAFVEKHHAKKYQEALEIL